MADAKWLSLKVDKSHYHYYCSRCMKFSKYIKTPYCAYCGSLMLNSEVKDK